MRDNVCHSKSMSSKRRERLDCGEIKTISSVCKLHRQLLQFDTENFRSTNANPRTNFSDENCWFRKKFSRLNRWHAGKSSLPRDAVNSIRDGKYLSMSFHPTRWLVMISSLNQWSVRLVQPHHPSFISFFFPPLTSFRTNVFSLETCSEQTRSSSGALRGDSC